MEASIDEEWSNYISCQNTASYESTTNINNKKNTPKVVIKECAIPLLPIEILGQNVPNPINQIEDVNVPKCSELYISTKTKVVFLNKEIDINDIFWKIPVIEYWKPIQGIVKKQMKIISKTVEEYNEYKKKLENIYYYTENIIKQIDNPNARRIKFKDERKITIGISKKDIMNCREKIKNAFYNCFAIILRFQYEGAFKEIHVKVFNTGKMEIPGILNNELLDIVKTMVLNIIQPHMTTQIYFIDNIDKIDDNVSKKYGIETSYDPCSYPGVKCKFYFNNDEPFIPDKQFGKITYDDINMKMSEKDDNQKYTEVSFMIFRTGSGLIVGNCSEKILVFIFNFIKNILFQEYENISVINMDTNVKVKKPKLRKKTIQISKEYLKLF